MSLIRSIINKIYGLGEKKRYNQIVREISLLKPKRIMEIGVFRGDTSLSMIKEAKRYSEVEYYGFDLFEDLSDEMFKKESSKRPLSCEEVRKKLEKSGAKIFLYKGDTKDILPKIYKTLPKMDFIFIDGGHSLETIENDWRYSKEVLADNGVMLLDDYWNKDDEGCKVLVDSLDRSKWNIKILPIQDRFKKDWGILEINLVEVKKK